MTFTTNWQFLPETAAKLGARDLVFGRDNELQTYHGKLVLMDNKRRKLFVIKQGKVYKFMPEIRLPAGLRLQTCWGAYALPLIPQPHWGLIGGGWRRGVVVSGVRRMNDVNARRARLVPGWVTVFGRVYHLRK